MNKKRLLYLSSFRRIAVNKSNGMLIVGKIDSQRSVNISRFQLDNAISTTFGIGRARINDPAPRAASSYGFDKLTFDKRNILNSYSRFDVHGRFAGYASVAPTTHASTITSMTKDSESHVRRPPYCLCVCAWKQMCNVLSLCARVIRG